MTKELTMNLDLKKYICFSDECTLYLNGSLNKQNGRYWNDEDPHLFREHHTQYPEKLNTWTVVLGDSVVGPFFIPGYLNGDMYLDILERLIVHELEN